MSADLDRELESIRRLLRSELGDPRFDDPGYLRWQYLEHPLGPAIYATSSLEGNAVAHYANLRCIYRRSSDRQGIVLTVNAATSRALREQGHFVSLGKQTYEQARREGYVGLIGVPNRLATGPALHYLDARLLGPLPARLLPHLPARRAGARSARFDPGRHRGWLDEITSAMNELPADHWTPVWNSETLGWRLARPSTSYSLHSTSEIAAISRVAEIRGARASVIMKLVPLRIPVPASAARALAAEVCAHNSTNVALYCGFNAHARLRGVNVPTRLRPAPLNLVHVSFDPAYPRDEFALDTFELLEFDAY